MGAETWQKTQVGFLLDSVLLTVKILLQKNSLLLRELRGAAALGSKDVVLLLINILNKLVL